MPAVHRQQNRLIVSEMMDEFGGMDLTERQDKRV